VLLVFVLSAFVLLLLGALVVFQVFKGSNENSSSEEDITYPVLEGTIYIKNEVELRNVIDNSVGKSVVIAFTKDIQLTESALSITNNTNITLTIDSKYGVCKIFGVAGNSTIVVEDGGVLTLNGVIVTHERISSGGTGVVVNSGGTVNMHSGEISGNVVNNSGGGIHNRGTFRLYGGKISDNTATNNGGGVYNVGDFEMYGGEITKNNANMGGGVYNRGTFNRLGGVIADNKATSRGYNWA